MSNSNAPSSILLTPFNYFEWKRKMITLLQSRGFTRIVEEKDAIPHQAEKRVKHLNKMDEAFGFICLHISDDLLFHADGLKSPYDLWIKLRSLFGKQDELRGYILENELVSLQPSNFESIQDFFSKFQNLVLHCKQCGITKSDEQLILSILSKLGSQFSVFVSTFHSVRMSIPRWKFPTLSDFIEALTQEENKLFQMGAIKTSRDLALLAGESSGANDKGGQKGKGKKPSRSKNDKQKRPNCTYCKRGNHPEHACMHKKIDLLTKLLEQNQIVVPKEAKMSDSGSGSDDCHALMAGFSKTKALLIDSGASNHMMAQEESFSSLDLQDGPTIHMGDNSQISAKGLGTVHMEHGKFKNVLFVPSLTANLLSVYQMTHTGSPKQVIFGPDTVEITEISTGKVIANGIANHASKAYEFSHFMPFSPTIPSDSDEDHSDFSSSDSYSSEEEDQDFDVEIIVQEDSEPTPILSPDSREICSHTVLATTKNTVDDLFAYRTTRLQQHANLALCHPPLHERFSMMMGFTLPFLGKTHHDTFAPVTEKVPERLATFSTFSSTCIRTLQRISLPSLFAKFSLMKACFFSA